MSVPLRARESGVSPSPAPPERDGATGDLAQGDLVQHVRERAEAQAAVGAVMRREEEKAARRNALEGHPRQAPPIKFMLLAALLAFNLYLWFGNPSWLTYNQPSGLSIDYYAASWRVAVYLQQQRIEEYRAEKGRLPATAAQAGQPVRGVLYTPRRQKDYELAAGAGAKQVVYHSTDSLSMLMGRTLLRMGLVAGGIR